MKWCELREYKWNEYVTIAVNRNLSNCENSPKKKDFRRFNVSHSRTAFARLPRRNGRFQMNFTIFAAIFSFGPIFSQVSLIQSVATNDTLVSRLGHYFWTTNNTKNSFIFLSAALCQVFLMRFSLYKWLVMTYLSYMQYKWSVHDARVV